MNPKTTVGLIIVLALLGGYAYFFEFKKVDESGNISSVYGILYGEYDIVGLELTSVAGVARFVRTADSFTRDWKAILPMPLPPKALDQVLINGSATALGRLTASQIITNVSSLAQYGLAPPAITVTLTISDGQKITIYTGAETPINNEYYITLAGDNKTVYTVSSYAINALRRLIVASPLVPTPLPTVTP